MEDIALREALKTLNERERAIINMRFYKGKTQIEIASEIGISQAQVSRLEKGALERIRKQMVKKGSPDPFFNANPFVSTGKPTG